MSTGDKYHGKRNLYKVVEELQGGGGEAIIVSIQGGCLSDKMKYEQSLEGNERERESENAWDREF